MARIIKNFNYEALVKSKVKGNKTDPVEALTKMIPQIEKLNVGDAVSIAIPSDAEPKKFLASIRAKATAAMREGSGFAGRIYRTSYRPEDNDVILYRDQDGKALPKRVSGRPYGSRNKKSSIAKKMGATKPLTESIEKAKDHLSGVVIKDLTKSDKEQVQA